jgi:hypothetical protein
VVPDVKRIALNQLPISNAIVFYPLKTHSIFVYLRMKYSRVPEVVEPEVVEAPEVAILVQIILVRLLDMRHPLSRQSWLSFFRQVLVVWYKSRRKK